MTYLALSAGPRLPIAEVRIREKHTIPLHCIVLCGLPSAIYMQNLIWAQSQHCPRPRLVEKRGKKIIKSVFFFLMFSLLLTLPSCSSPLSPFFSIFTSFFLLSPPLSLLFFLFFQSLFLFLSHLLFPVFSSSYIFIHVYILINICKLYAHIYTFTILPTLFVKLLSYLGGIVSFTTY